MKACQRCGDGKATHNIVGAHDGKKPIMASLCPDCYSGWYDLRDKEQEALFRQYILNKK